MTERHPSFTQPKDRTPDDFDHDLHPNSGAGVNHQQLGANPEMAAPSAETMEELHVILSDFNNDELRRIMILQPGDRLEQGATYLDLRKPDREEFKATGEMVVGPPNINLIVPKSQVDYQLWNRLRGVDNPERTGQADD